MTFMQKSLDTSIYGQEIQQDTPQLEEYKILYFDAVKTINRLTSIQDTLKNTSNCLSNIQTQKLIDHYQAQVDFLNEQIKQKNKLNQILATDLKQANQLHFEKEQNAKKKLEVEIRKKQLLQEELILLKDELRLTRKQFQNEKLQIDKDQPKGKASQAENYSKTEQYQNLSKVIMTSQSAVNKAQCEIKQLKNKLGHCQTQIKKLNSLIGSNEQIHRLQISIKERMINSLKEENQKKEQKIVRLEQETSTNHSKLNTSIEIQQLQKDLKTKIKTIDRLTSKLNGYQNLLEKYSNDQQRFHRQLTQHSIQIQSIQTREQQYIQQIHQLTQTLESFKNSYIHSELLKQQVLRKYYQQKKRLQASRLVYLSKSKLSRSSFTLENSAFTPINSLKNTRMRSTDTETMQSQTKSSVRIAKKSHQNSFWSQINTVQKVYPKSKKLKLKLQKSKSKSSEATAFEL